MTDVKYLYASFYRTHVLSEYRRNAGLKNMEHAAKLVALTRDYTFLLESVNGHLVSLRVLQMQKKS